MRVVYTYRRPGLRQEVSTILRGWYIDSHKINVDGNGNSGHYPGGIVIHSGPVPDHTVVILFTEPPSGRELLRLPRDLMQGELERPGRVIVPGGRIEDDRFNYRYAHDSSRIKFFSPEMSLSIYRRR